MKESTNLAPGTLLLAEPFMVDPNFRRSAVLLCESADEGSVGFIFNKSLKMKVGDLVEDFPEFDADVFFGGPVQTDTIHYIHNVGDLLEGSAEIIKGLYWGGDFDKLKFLADAKLIKPANIRFFVGYSGWTDGQLKEEIKFGSWVKAKMDVNYLFKTAPEEVWQQVMENKGNAFTVLAQLPENLNSN